MKYPRMIYKTRNDHCIVKNAEEHEYKKTLGYKTHWEDEHAEKEEPKVIKKTIEVKPIRKRKRGK